MPNWCMNELSVSGTAKELKNFVFATQGLPAQYPLQACEKNEFKKTEKPCFCFNALIPTPDEVLQIGYDGHDKISKDAMMHILTGQPIYPIDGYYWNIQNWGTKWDVYYDNITPKKMGWSKGCTSILFNFDTAWSPPLKWFEKVVEKFPQLSFQLHYSEPSGYFAGDIYGNDGQCVYDEYDDERCNALFRRLCEEIEKEDSIVF